MLTVSLELDNVQLKFDCQHHCRDKLGRLNEDKRFFQKEYSLTNTFF